MKIVNGRPWHERANWPDVRAAIATIRRGDKCGFPQAVLRYDWIPPAQLGQFALDVCCGSGQGALILQEKGYIVSAFDRCSDCADLLGRAGVSFQIADVVDYSPVGRFDLITCCDALEHLSNPAGALRKFHDWLLPDGRLYLTVPLEGASTPNPFHVNAWTWDSFQELLRATAWAVTQKHRLHSGRGLFWGMVAPAGIGI